MRNKFITAGRILSRYRISLLNSLADEVAEHEEEFAQSVFGKGEEIVESYSRRFSSLACVMGALQEAIPQRRAELKVEQFHCPQSEVALRLGDWIQAHEGTLPQALKLVAEGSNCTCLVTYFAKSNAESAGA